MRFTPILLTCLTACLLASCSKSKLDEKGFRVTPESAEETETQADAIHPDSLKFETRPSTVLLTGVQNYRLTTVYKVNLNKEDGTTYIGSDNFLHAYEESEDDKANNWNGNWMPGFKVVQGYNMVNVGHYDIVKDARKDFFERPVLVKNLYFPTPSSDTLNGIPVKREYFMVSVYNEDTNKDGILNIKDLRRFYLYSIDGIRQRALVPENYSVFKSKYDHANDWMFVFAQLDSDNNGRRTLGEPIHIFGIDLKDPMKTGRMY